MILWHTRCATPCGVLRVHVRQLAALYGRLSNMKYDQPYLGYILKHQSAVDIKAFLSLQMAGIR